MISVKIILCCDRFRCTSSFESSLLNAVSIFRLSECITELGWRIEDGELRCPECSNARPPLALRKWAEKC